MSRIRKAYETRFHWLLRQAGARRHQQAVEAMVRRAERLSAAQGISLTDALKRLFEQVAAHPFFRHRAPQTEPSGFFCDAGLGGLARWLRAAGYEAWWEDGIDDDQLLAETRKRSATLLTTDSMLMERRVLRDRLIPSLWLPPTLKVPEQLDLVMREFNLGLRAPRCMSCGGPLRSEAKEVLRERIPPRTYQWCDTYFLCIRCGKLFWHGTHWQRIQEKLGRSAAARGAEL